MSLKNLNLPLRLLVDNEILRLTVWSNPTSDPKRGPDHAVSIEKTMLDVSPCHNLAVAYLSLAAELLD